jgi:hypothetical protein
MMDELVQRLSQKTGMSPDEAQQAVNIVVNHLKEKLPAPLASGLDSLLASGSLPEGENLVEKAKAVASGLESMFGQKAE